MSKGRFSHKLSYPVLTDPQHRYSLGMFRKSLQASEAPGRDELSRLTRAQKEVAKADVRFADSLRG